MHDEPLQLMRAIALSDEARGIIESLESDGAMVERRDDFDTRHHRWFTVIPDAKLAGAARLPVARIA